MDLSSSSCDMSERLCNQSILDKSAGRWTTEEHKLFLQGLQLHNKQWKLIADLVKTRTVVQIRTHAQKYFQKMEKANVRKSDGSHMNASSSFDLSDADGPSLHPPRSSSISSADSMDSINSGTTSSEGESDSELGSPRSFVGSTNLTLILSKSKSRSDVLKKRTRESKGMELKTIKSKKLLVTKKGDYQVQSKSMEEFDDFFPLIMEEDEDIEESIVNLLDKIDWSMEATSRANSPFMDSASSVCYSVDYTMQDSPQHSVQSPPLRYSPRPDMPYPVCSSTNLNLNIQMNNNNNANVIALSGDEQFSSQHQQQPYLHLHSMPSSSEVTSSSSTSQQPSNLEARSAFSHVLSEFKQLIQHVTITSQLPGNHCPSNNNNQQVLPSLRALAIMSSAGMKVSFPDTLTPLNTTLCHYLPLETESDSSMLDL